MKLIQPPPPEPLSSTNCHSNNNRLRRRPDLTLPLPLRDSHSDEANRLWARVSDLGFFSRNLITNPWLSEHLSRLLILLLPLFLSLLWNSSGFFGRKKKSSFFIIWANDDNIIILADFSDIIKSMPSVSQGMQLL
jgi:hypothetical protein